MNLTKWILSAFLPFAATGVQAGDVVTIPRNGATIVDGDGFKTGRGNYEIIYRLHGIDAPEWDQTCTCNGRVIHCGYEATGYLYNIMRNRSLKCEVLDIDRYKRRVVRCLTLEGDDINAAMVRDGYAVAEYSNDYKPLEEIAKAAGIGLWKTDFVRPKIYRDEKRER